MYMWTLCIHARPTPVRSFPEQNRTRQIEKLWTFYWLSYIRKRGKKKKDTKNYNPNPDERLKSEKGEKKKNIFFTLFSEAEIYSWANPNEFLVWQGPSWKTLVSISLVSGRENATEQEPKAVGGRTATHARCLLPSQRPDCQHRASLQLSLLNVGRDGVAPCLGGLCSLCFFPASSEWKWQDHSRKAAKKMSVYFS